MYIDFELSESGDIVFEEKEDISQPLKVKFYMSKNKILKLNFNFIADEDYITAAPLKATFNINKDKKNIFAKILKNDDVKKQLILLKLKNVKGELALRPDFGSNLTMMRHSVINEKNLNIIKQIVLETINEYIYNPKIEVEATIDNIYQYKNIIKIYIYENDSLIIEYKIDM